VHVHAVADGDRPIRLHTEAAEVHGIEFAQIRTAVPSPILAPPKIGLVLFVTPPDGWIMVGCVLTAKFTGPEGGPSVLST
jgi:hypothetical protein